MPRGYPDRFGQPQFPSYGIPQRVYASSEFADPNVKKTIIDISGKGKTYGGVIYFYSAYDNRDCLVELEVDDVVIFQQDFKDMLRYRVIDGNGSTVWLTDYDWDGVSGDWAIRINADITFNTSLKLHITPTISGKIMYWVDFAWVKVEG